MKKLAIFAIALFLAPAAGLLATGTQEAGPATLTLWFPAGEITEAEKKANQAIAAVE